MLVMLIRAQECSICMINVYMPCRGLSNSESDFRDTLDRVQEVTNKDCVCSRFYQWYQWYTNIVQGSTNGTTGNTIGTNGNANGTIGSPNGSIGIIGKPMVPLATNGYQWYHW